MLKQHLLIIDPQKDFCNPTGSLYVTGADKDMERLSELIKRLNVKIEDIHVTLDSHHLFDIAHPIFWVDSHGKHPSPFTMISEDDVKKGVWLPSVRSLKDHCIHYVEQLKANNRYALVVWPPHCLIGSEGYAIYEPLYKSLLEWEDTNIAFVDYVTKGSNYLTEHYSAVQADVPDPSDPSTSLNDQLIKILKDADRILIAGEALSHCVANTVTDIANNFGEDNIKKIVLLEDCCSNVGGFENLGKQFVDTMSKRGMQIAKSTDIG